MVIILLLFTSTNIIAFYYVIKFMMSKKFTNIDYLYVISALIINMCLLVFYINLSNGVSQWINYFLFLISGICGLYGLLKGNQLIVIPTLKLKRKLTKEDVLLKDISKHDKGLAITTYLVSFIAMVILYVRNL